MTDLHTIDSINADLLSKYRVLDGRPIYRVVFSKDQLEKRKGEFNDYLGQIFLRKVIEVREVKKYWYINPACWILEKLVFPVGVQALKDLIEELPEAVNGSYEPLYMFKDAANNQLPVSQRVIDFILWNMHNPGKKLPSDIEADRLAEELAEYKYFEEEIGASQRSELFAFENSAFVSTNQLDFKRKQNGQS